MNTVVGYGEIGQAVNKVIGEAFIIDLDTKSRPKETEVLHICFPYSKTFIKDVKQYISELSPKYTVIWSTVPIGTTKQIKGAVHSPVEGKHPELARSIKDGTRWIGANEDGAFFEDYFKRLYLKTKLVKSSDYTEALKLLSTTEYGVNIEFARYKKQVADDLGMDFELTKEWNKDYNKLYHNLGMNWAQKYILDAPEGAKGGHCVTPNARLLYKQFPDDLVKKVAEL